MDLPLFQYCDLTGELDLTYDEVQFDCPNPIGPYGPPRGPR